MNGHMPPPSPSQAAEAFTAEAWYLDRHSGPSVIPTRDEFSSADAWVLAGGRTYTLNVKHTNAVPRGPHFGLRLIVKPRTNGSVEWCDIYVLIKGGEPDYRVVGWAWGIDVSQHWDSTLPFPAYAMSEEWLHPGDPLEQLRAMEHRGLRPLGPPMFANGG
jgi:hypothetical protein